MRAPSNKTIADAALDYAARGWKPVPVNRKTKRPIGKEWQKRPFSPAQFNGNAQNVGIQLGAESNGLLDIDLDSTTAIGLAPEFLPPTAAIFGRRSKPCSHQLYIADLCKTEPRAAIRFENGGGVIVELRIGGANKGAVTVFPPSMHITGEMVQWVNDGEPAQVAGDVLLRSVTQLAIACVLKQAYPGQGLRHDAALALGGVLARSRWKADEIAHLAAVVARAADDDEIEDRSTAAASAVEAKANGEAIYGLTRFTELWGEDAAKSLRKWLHYQDPPGPGAASAGFEDSVALAFAEQQKEHFRYVAASNQWMKWTGSRWQHETTLSAFDEARKLCRNAGDAAAKRVAAVTTLARADRRIAATTEQWDADPEVINVPIKEMSP
jgi:hypothetical protein